MLKVRARIRIIALLYTKGVSSVPKRDGHPSKQSENKKEKVESEQAESSDSYKYGTEWMVGG